MADRLNHWAGRSRGQHAFDQFLLDIEMSGGNENGVGQGLLLFQQTGQYLIMFRQVVENQPPRELVI